MFITLYKIDGVHFRLLGTNGFHVKAKNERFTAASSRCRQNLKYENFTSSFGRLRQNTAPKKRAARAARLFFFIQPIKSLICGVVFGPSTSWAIDSGPIRASFSINDGNGNDNTIN